MIDKYKEDKKYRNKIKLIGYGIFIIIAMILAITGSRNATPINEALYDYTNTTTNNSNNNIINIFDKYTYIIDVIINENNYNFNGEYNNDVLTINKEDKKYEYKNGNYYLSDTDELVNENIYNPVDSKYLDISLINQYLNKAKYEDNIYKVYLKDIILGNDSNDYITIDYRSNLNEINIEVDYTNLLKYFNNDIEKYFIVMKYNKIID